MMKKEYQVPKVIIRNIILENMIALSTGTGGSYEGADARANDNWDDDDEEVGGIWED